MENPLNHFHALPVNNLVQSLTHPSSNLSGNGSKDAIFIFLLFWDSDLFLL
jgi:hypothetical protein